MSRRNLFGSLAVSLFSLLAVSVPTDAHADFLGAWVRADGSYISGSEDLRFFSENQAGPAYGAAIGVEILQIDLFMDLNFFPDGEMFNLAGLGFDMNLIPVDGFRLAPSAQVAYVYGGHAENEVGDKGFLARVGAQAEVELVPTIWLGVDAYGGGLLTYGPEKETGLVYSGSAYLIFQFNLL